jgi:hypothetical protein
MCFELALVYAEIGRPEEATPHLARCQEIMAAGENWKGMAGIVLMAEAVVEAALCNPRQGSASDGRGAPAEVSTVVQEGFQQAQARFASAIEIFRRYQVPWDHAETLYHWGRGLIATGRGAEGAEKLDTAVEVYRRYGAGQPWIDRALAAKPDRSATTMRQLPKAEAAAIFRREGDYWTMSFQDKLCRLRDAKGLRYIAHLLRNPGAEQPVDDGLVTADGLLINYLSSTAGEVARREKRDGQALRLRRCLPSGLRRPWRCAG